MKPRNLFSFSEELLQMGVATASQSEDGAPG
jgi:hypothetical protein